MINKRKVTLFSTEKSKWLSYVSKQNYSEMPKLERLKSRNRQNPDALEFSFQTAFGVYKPNVTNSDAFFCAQFLDMCPKSGCLETGRKATVQNPDQYRFGTFTVV